MLIVVRYDGLFLYLFHMSLFVGCDKNSLQPLKEWMAPESKKVKVLSTIAQVTDPVSQMAVERVQFGTAQGAREIVGAGAGNGGATDCRGSGTASVRSSIVVSSDLEPKKHQRADA